MVDAHIAPTHLLIIMGIIFLPMLGINCLKNLKILAPFSTLGKNATCEKGDDAIYP
jgi:hypothetical protein